MAKVPTPPQFVLLAFDGSNEVEFWKATRQFAASAEVRFTYFISGVFFLLDADKNIYVDPAGRNGKSNIGFGGPSLDVMKQRLEQVRLAMKEGHEIGSHANGHFDGRDYTFGQWNKEFQQFTSIMSKTWQRYNKAAEPAGWKNYFAKEVSGFRAPYLSVGDRKALWKTLKEHGIDYDTSLVNNMGYWPRQIDGVWNFPLATINVAGTPKNTLSMDYNFYVAQSGGKDGPKEKFKEYEDQMVQSYVQYFNQQLLWQSRADAYRASLFADERRRLLESHAAHCPLCPQEAGCHLRHLQGALEFHREEQASLGRLSGRQFRQTGRCSVAARGRGSPWRRRRCLS